MSNKKNIKSKYWFIQLLTFLFMLLLAVGSWYASKWTKNELFISFLMKAFSIALIAMFIWGILDWLATKTNSKWLKKLVSLLALIGKYTFYSIGAARDIALLLITGFISLLFVYAIFSLPFIIISNYLYPLELKLIIYLAISISVISFLELGNRIFKLISLVCSPYTKLKPSRADLIEVFRLVFTGKTLRFLVYFIFFLYLIFYAAVDLSNITNIKIHWLASLYNIKESVLYSFYTVLAYDAFRVHLINYEAKE